MLAAILLCAQPVLTTLAPPPEPDPVTVFAAASLGNAFEELSKAFHDRHPGALVRVNAAGSPTLVAQLEQGARADILATADSAWMDRAGLDSLLAELPVVFASNRLVVAVPAGNPAGLTRLQDLARGGIKLVLAGPEVPAGRYAIEVLGRLGGVAGFPPDYQARVLASRVSSEENVKLVLAKVRLGEADAGIVYVSDLVGPGGQGVGRLEIPPSANVVARYPIALVKRSTAREVAREFIRFVLSDAGQAVLRGHGFGPP
jgi:molybdate transport system substrate-binding protein